MSVVFIHGAGCSSDAFRFQLDQFDGAHFPNLPGHLTSGSTASIDGFAEFIEAYIQEHCPQDAVLCGHSMGGAVAIQTALRKNAHVRGLVLLGSGAKLRVAPAILQGLQNDFEAAIAQVARFFFADATPERVEWAKASMRQVGAAQTYADFAVCDAFDALDRLSEITVPLLALTGESDKMTPPKFAQALADRVPGAQARIVPGAGHFVMVEQPAETNTAIGTFLAGLPPS